MPRTRSTRLVLASLCLLVFACSSPAIRQKRVPGVYGSVIGSVVIQLERTKSSAWDGFFDEDLALHRPKYVFHFGSRDRSWATPTERVSVEWGEPKPFVIALRPGSASLEDLELVVYDGPDRWLMSAVSATDGKRFPLDLEFTVDPRRITYIGRIQVVLPRRLNLFSSEPRVSVQDASSEDRESMGTLIELTKLPVTTALARPGAAR